MNPVDKCAMWKQLPTAASEKLALTSRGEPRRAVSSGSRPLKGEPASGWRSMRGSGSTRGVSRSGGEAGVRGFLRQHL